MANPLRVLMLEDIASDAEIMGRALQDVGYDPVVTIVETEQDYRVQLNNTPEIILADFTLPDLDGFQALEIHEECRPDIPIIIVSGVNGEERAVEVMKRGATDYIMKDRMAILGYAVEHALENKGGRDQTMWTAQHLIAQQGVTHALAAALTLATAAGMILRAICHNLDWDFGAFWQLDEHDNVFRCVDCWRNPVTPSANFEAMTRHITFAPTSTSLGRVQVSGQAVWIPDVALDPDFPGGSKAAEAGLHAACAFPIILGTQTLGIVELLRCEIKQSDDKMLQMMAAFGSQIGQFIERKRAEDALWLSEARIRLLIDGIQDHAVLMLDRNGNIRTWNSGAEQLFGYAREEIVGQSLQCFLPPTNGELACDVNDFQKALFNGKVEGEDWRVRKNGTLFWAHYTLAPVSNPQGELQGFTYLTRDLSERKRAETELSNVCEELSRSNLDLDAYAYAIPHDLQEPLRALGSCVHVLKKRYEAKLDSRADELIGYAVDGARRMQRLIDDLLVYSQIATLGKPLEQRDGNAILMDALAKLGTTIADAEAVVTHDPLPTVFADAAQLTQVFQQLIGNAIKFRGQEPPRIHIDARLADDYWVFSVKDNGLGVRPEYFTSIFVMFQRLHPNSAYVGTGAGLAICKKIIARHGGHIAVASEPDKGSTFSFTLPEKGKIR